MKKLFNPVLELTHNHGTEHQEDFSHFTGNEPERKGFGHIGFLVEVPPPPLSLPFPPFVCSTMMLRVLAVACVAPCSCYGMSYWCGLILLERHGQDVEATCVALEELGTSFKKKPMDGSMKGLAFAQVMQ